MAILKPVLISRYLLLASATSLTGDCASVEAPRLPSWVPDHDIISVLK